MATVQHGIGTAKIASSVSTPIVADSGVIFAVGTAPVQMMDSAKVNEVVMANNYEEAVSALGYSDDWEKYSLCELMYTAFQLYGVGPVFMVNVLDPAAHKASVEQTDMTTTDNQIKLPLEAIASSVAVDGKTVNTVCCVALLERAACVDVMVSRFHQI